MDPQSVGFIIIALVSGVTGGILIAWLILKKSYAGEGGISAEEYRQMLAEDASRRTLLDEKTKQAARLESELAAARESASKLGSELASKNTMIDNLNQRLRETKAEIEALNAKFTEEFRKVANQVLLQNSSEFNKQTVERLSTVLTPLKEYITRFEKKIDDAKEKQIQESASLKEQISQLTSLNQRMSEEAKNLTNALKGESKTRGTWGEMILESILDRSGLIKNEHYTLQKGFKDGEGSTLKPDVIIHMPEQKHLVIDSKLSLVDYERYCNVENSEERKVHLKNHIGSIKRHISELAGKNYQNLYGITPPDFVLMFIPIESALHTALESDGELYNDALQRNIVLLSPTTLIPTLKIIYNIWRQEKQNRNALAIADAGGRLYDKLVAFVGDLQDVGQHIDRSKKSYESALSKLSSGRGNLVGMAEKMKALGAKTSKQLPPDLLIEE